MRLIDEKDLAEAIREMRIGELKHTVGIVSSKIAAMIAMRSLPMHSDCLKLSMPQRRFQVAVTLQAIANELEEESKRWHEEASRD